MRSGLLYPQVVPATNAATVLLLIERRAVLRQLDVLEVGIALLDAAASGDVLTTRAITEAATFDAPFQIDPAQKLAAKEIAASRERPEVGQSLKTLRAAFTILSNLIADAQREVGLIDPIKQAAGAAT